MAFEETREQQQMYNYFRSCIYIFLIIEIVMNLPSRRITVSRSLSWDLLGRFKVFNSISGCKVAELDLHPCGLYRNQGKQALKFNVKTMVIYPVLAGLTFCRDVFYLSRHEYRHELVRLPGEPHPQRASAR